MIRPGSGEPPKGMSAGGVQMTIVERLTLDQFLEQEESEPASEFVCGEVIQKPTPNETHGAIQLWLGALIMQFLAHTPLGRVRSEWRCVFGSQRRRRALVPDLTYASLETYRRGQPGSSGFLMTAPDLTVEIVSPGQSASRFAEKILFYVRNGVREVWVIDPAERTVMVYRHDDVLILEPGDVLDGGDVLPGFQAAVVDIFAQAAQ
jgi:Uma2 family endonuclease